MTRRWTQDDEDNYWRLPDIDRRLIHSIERLQRFRSHPAPAVLIQREEELLAERLKMAGLPPEESEPGSATMLRLAPWLEIMALRRAAREDFNRNCENCRLLHPVEKQLQRHEHCAAFPGEIQPNFLTPCLKKQRKGYLQ